MKTNTQIDKSDENSHFNPLSSINHRKLTTAKFIIVFSIIILLFLAGSNYLYSNNTLFYSNAILLFIIVATIIFFKKKVMLLAHLVLGLMALGILAIVYLNKGQEYVPIWSFVFIYIAMIMYGYKKGVFVVVAFCSVLLGLLFIWIGDTINILEFICFSSVILVLTLFSYISERHISTTLQQLATTQNHLEKMNKIDALTEVYNRRQFDIDFSQKINSAKRSKKTLAFAMLDIDYFKFYNDNYGHQLGDQALVKVAQQLKNKMKRANDTVYRLGGEEFAILFQVESDSEAVTTLNEVQHSIEELKIDHLHNKVSNYLTISAGLFLLSPADNIDKTQAYKICDELLYKAKSNGRNRVSYDIPHLE